MKTKYMLWCLPCEKMFMRAKDKGVCPNCKGDLFNTGYTEVDESPVKVAAVDTSTFIVRDSASAEVV